MVSTISFSNQNFHVFRVNGNGPWSTYIWGLVQRREYAELLGQIDSKWRPVH